MPYDHINRHNEKLYGHVPSQNLDVNTRLARMAREASEGGGSGGGGSSCGGCGCLLLLIVIALFFLGGVM